MSKPVPSRAEVVIVGGGIVGTAIAYHLPKFGIHDVVLLERKKLTSGTTWHAAGMVGRYRPLRIWGELGDYVLRLIRSIEEETGQSTGFKQNGGYQIALNDDRWEIVRRMHDFAEHIGVRTRLVSPAELGDAWPLLDLEGVRGALHIPETGQINPVDYTMALAKGARLGGAQIFEDTKVNALVGREGRITGVETEHGVIEAKTVVLAAGMWTRELARTVGVHVPLHAVEHFYMVTEPIAGLDPNTPGLVIPDERSYYKEDAGKLLVGTFERRGKSWATHGIPDSFEFDSLPEDHERYEGELQLAMARVPRLASAGVQTFFIGPESFTADGRYLIGPTPEVKGLFVSAGFNSSGIMSSGSMGKVVAEWIATGNSPIDMHGFSLSRSLPFQSSRRFMEERASEAIGLWGTMPWPGRQMETARGVRRMPLHAELKQSGAHFGERAGWEIPLWYSTRPPQDFQYRLGRQDWYPCVEAECLALRDRVAMIDQSSFGKFIVEGDDALSVLNTICAADVDDEIGKVVYTAWLNEKGGFEADLTVTRTAPRSFLIVTGPGHHRSDHHWLTDHIPQDARLHVEDVTSSYGLLAIMGPNSRALLQGLSDDDLSNEAFPFGRSKTISLGYVSVRASRVTFVGELGYELLVSTDMCGYVHDLLKAAGQAHGFAYAGLNALNSCRVERGYRLMGVDIGCEDTPVEAGLAFAVGWKKPGDFIGRAPVEAQRGKPPASRLLQFALEGKDAPILTGDEIIWRNGERVGTITSGGWGFRIQRSLGMGYVKAGDGVTPTWIEQGDYEIQVAGQKFRADAQLEPFYDPTGTRAKC